MLSEIDPHREILTDLDYVCIIVAFWGCLRGGGRALAPT